MMRTVLQHILVVKASAQSGTSDQVVDCRESSASDVAPETSEVEHERRSRDATDGWTGSAQGPSQPTRTVGAQDSGSTGSNVWISWFTRRMGKINVFGPSFDVSDSGTGNLLMEGTRVVRLL